MKEVTTYVTPDGKSFTDQDEAQAHEHALKVGKEIDAYLDGLADDEGNTLEGRSRSMRRNAILAWEVHRAAEAALKAAKKAA